MTAKEYCIAFCDGYFYAQLGEKLTNGKVTEHALDLAKEITQDIFLLMYCQEHRPSLSSQSESSHHDITP